MVFGNEVWMGLVDFKSEKSQPEDVRSEILMEEEFGRFTRYRGGFNGGSERWWETKFGGDCA